ncbi:MAG: SMP-30/gluconolactonase/LRE family protein [Hyphomicrobiaceae bacterium]
MDAVGGLGTLGSDLDRPECVVAHASGNVFVPDWRDGGGIMQIRPDGTQRRIVARTPAEPMRPNGIALEPGGTFLLAHLGDQTGGIWRLAADGAVEPVVTALDGAPLPPSNFVMRDAEGRLYITVSTRHRPRDLAFRADVTDGFIVLVDRGRARIVADGLGYTNECVLAADGRTLYVNETYGRRTSAFDVAADGGLTNRRIVATYGPGTFPDGLTLDVVGCLWITCVVSNRLIRLHPGGHQEMVLEDADPTYLAEVIAAYDQGEMRRSHIATIASRRLRHISSLAFAGADLTNQLIGSLLDTSLYVRRASVAGLAPPHWTFDLGPLGV